MTIGKEEGIVINRTCSNLLPSADSVVLLDEEKQKMVDTYMAD